ncbi:DUF4142 domain-containing protein [Nonomuraea pusilla]|uniref:DUF4142 domain-containing protein n=1 Tax=Nonomuraea pusilla TaxID=46177 RepID=UPI002737EEBF|nr:DUF4142 domain-containing protein [Nonomuraea pusilla]
MKPRRSRTEAVPEPSRSRAEAKLTPGSRPPHRRRNLGDVLDRPGRRFDRAWLRLQAEAHEQALWLGRREVRAGHSRWVKDLARDAAPVVRHHLHLVRAELDDR